MFITVTDPLLLQQLRTARPSADLFGPDGEFIGTFQPPRGTLPPGVRSPFTDEEPAAMRKERSGRPPADILRDLETRDRDSRGQ